MKTISELREEADRLNPYSQVYFGHVPWREGYLEAATKYEKEVLRLREMLRRAEGGTR
jgi:hypothetical protein